MPAELPAALADVRSDATATDWCLCGFEATTLGLVMVGSGTGGVGAMAALLSSDNSFYGLVRTKQIVDPRAPPQVRFVFVFSPLLPTTSPPPPHHLPTPSQPPAQVRGWLGPEVARLLPHEYVGTAEAPPAKGSPQARYLVITPPSPRARRRSGAPRS